MRTMTAYPHCNKRCNKRCNKQGFLGLSNLLHSVAANEEKILESDADNYCTHWLYLSSFLLPRCVEIDIAYTFLIKCVHAGNRRNSKVIIKASSKVDYLLLSRRVHDKAIFVAGSE